MLNFVILPVKSTIGLTSFSTSVMNFPEARGSFQRASSVTFSKNSWASAAKNRVSETADHFPEGAQTEGADLLGLRADYRT